MNSQEEKNQQIVENSKQYVKQVLEGAESGHDFDHILRVYKLAKTLAQKTKEPVNTLVVELGALMHDVYDHKFCEDENKGPNAVREFLQKENCDPFVIDRVIDIMQRISYSKGLSLDFIEGKLVQDADRLDAIGAIGIARTFSYGGYKGRKFYDADELKQVDLTKPPIKNGATVTHFYEKLLLLKDKLNTEAGKEIAQSRHDFMVTFLDRFYAEWEGEQ